MKVARASGVLLHPTSLPGPFGIGDFGPEARRFVDFLAAAGQSFWQIMPLGPPGYGGSPYASTSAFAGNVNLVSPEGAGRRRPPRRVRSPRRARLPGRSGGPGEGHRVQAGRARARVPSLRGPRARRPGARARRRARARPRVGVARRLRPVRRPQGRPRRRRLVHVGARARPARARGPRRRRGATSPTASRRTGSSSTPSSGSGSISGATPTSGASASSATCPSSSPTTRPTCGRTRASGSSTRRSPRASSPGCRPTPSAPPASSGAARSTTGTISARTASRGGSTGCARRCGSWTWCALDHFRGFAACWEVPAEDDTAEPGLVGAGAGPRALRGDRRGPRRQRPADPRRGPGPDHATMSTPSATSSASPACASCSSRGTAIATTTTCPTSIARDVVAYTGTHDNDTVVGWFAHRSGPEASAAERRERDSCLRYLGSDGAQINWDFIRAVQMSVAALAIVPLQDLLGLGSDARMNTPGRAEGNWAWRYRQRRAHRGARPAPPRDDRDLRPHALSGRPLGPAAVTPTARRATSATRRSLARWSSAVSAVALHRRGEAALRAQGEALERARGARPRRCAARSSSTDSRRGGLRRHQAQHHGAVVGHGARAARSRPSARRRTRAGSGRSGSAANTRAMGS